MNDMINTNVIGVNNTVVPFIPKMLEQYSGHIAVVGSVASFVAWPGSELSWLKMGRKSVNRFFKKFFTKTNSCYFNLSRICKE